MGKYEQLAKDIIKNVGGKENVLSLTHCVTRLRFQLKDEGKANTDVLKNMDGVVTVMQTAGQYQVVIGNHVPDVFKDVCEVAGISGGEGSGEKVKRKFSEAALDIISGIFMPSIGILCASGILKGVNIILDMAGLIPAASGLGQILAGAADAMFWFFPIILGFNAFKKLGGNPYLGMTLGAALCYPALQGVNLNVLGFNVNATYTSTMLPILVMSFIAVPMEKWLNKVVPDVVKTFVVPAVVLFVCVPVGFCLIGPAANEVGAIINNVIQGAYGFSPIVAGILLGFLWQLLVMVGCHVLVVLPMMMGLMAGEPQPLMAVVAFPSFVQTGAVFAIWLKSKNKKLKTIALPAWISGIFGVTEPAIYGVTLPNGKQFILTCVGAGVIGGLSVLLGVSQFTMGGMGVFALPAMIDPANGSGSIISAVIVAVAAIVIGFIIAFVTYKDKKEAVIENKEEKLVKGREVICSPINGNVLPLSEAKDDAFAQGLLGNGVAIDPADGKVVSPVDGTVMTLFPTKHAIGLVSDNGAEILIHLGMDTVKLDGKYFEAHVKQGDKVKKGDVLVTCDVEAIKAEGYSMITPVIVTNTADYLDVVEMASGTVKAGDDIISCLN
ncbi:beta-glucoside-specific PTS transporter subunit IIABC [Amedibacterium intestinale]|jgi:PTS system, beta-glucoside-specific, IIABC component|uniref:beta-glucoside-specific PTS transporter subunit IIABC n=1 Tax=Amedibacterium intestinale TaxID=2583452 RepID=UPI000E513B3C|nr:beta-glucoside-specific PTS transporter subunit IIABC [Amedibacterium intestinale]RHO20969.1 PTS beta-glucoside transporter subunit IIABC [Eubacterium sp. AM18-26]RHO25087.1 PTS beta-glucoside transporter subunit IIABC [Eubacterium sp. AM18-10LB-B]BBK62640.1 PTS beta-glucoside transporter subunit EIIBCA [Amedibacterium intestinale]